LEIPFEFEHRLEMLGISVVAEWDVLLFLLRHGTTIASDANMVRLIGYSPSVIKSALEGLTKAGLIQSSRSDGTGLYKLIPLDTPARQDCLEALIKMADLRSGRLQLIGALRKSRA
jgi:DNA-binding MarR family transcriptional regulator